MIERAAPHHLVSDQGLGIHRMLIIAICIAGVVGLTQTSISHISSFIDKMAEQAMAQELRALWETPSRAITLVALDLTPRQEIEVQQYLLQQEYAVDLVERGHPDLLAVEQHVTKQGIVSMSTAIEVGRVRGAHIVLEVSAVGEGLTVRSIGMESFEVLAASFVTEKQQLRHALSNIVQSALALLPLRAYIVEQSGMFALSAGSRHGVHTGDFFQVQDSEIQLEVLTVEKNLSMCQLRHLEDYAIVTGMDSIPVYRFMNMQ